MSTVFDSFTNLYSLTKTLRFELKPELNTLDHMKDDLKYDENLKTFLVDDEIEKAYQILKPVLDRIHEIFINESLQSESVKQLDFTSYFQIYREKGDLKESETTLRASFSDIYSNTAEAWKKRAKNDKNGKDIFLKKGYKILTEKGVLDYIKENLDFFTDLVEPTILIKTLSSFNNFFTYFGGFNQNRENYYETKKEAATSVATRIVHDNLPKFCDNILFFEKRSEEYVDIFNELKTFGIAMVNKDGQELYAISRDLFFINNFNCCLSENQIESYNAHIGNANFLVNLYNQYKKSERDYKKLSMFKSLYKQIGCSDRKLGFFVLTNERKCDAEKTRNEKNDAYSVEELFESAIKAAQKYLHVFSEDGGIVAVPDLVEYLRNRDNYLGIYWSKAAINTISSKYFSNWHELKDKLVLAKVFNKAKLESDDDVKIPDAVELEGLFRVLDETENWKELLFRKNVIDNDEKKGIVMNAKSPSKALLSLIFADISNLATIFIKKYEEIISLPDFKSENSKKVIKEWFDGVLGIYQILKYFFVRENKAKGSPLDPLMMNSLEILLNAPDARWFIWYDSLRNYLTQKPQEDVKRNKLKLNFENGSLLGGWSDGQEKNKAAVLLRKNDFYYIGILKKKSIFDTSKVNNQIYNSTTFDAGRLILANLKFQTLAGKGFLGEFKVSYGEMGKQNPMLAVSSLQKIMKDRYIKKYPLLERIALGQYNDKKSFDKDIQETLPNCYTCEFKSINWAVVEKHVEVGDLYLFKLLCKDFKETKKGKQDLQSIYWNTVFEKDSPFQLNAGAEIFYRKQAISEKKIKKGYEDKSYIIENKRFTSEKFLFHCPIKLNYNEKNYSKIEYSLPEINKKINIVVSTNESIHFLGIDRGEKHLAYYYLIDRHGNKIEQGSLNIINGQDYNTKLGLIEKNRMEWRKNWQTIGTIKEMKEGYISQVVKKIADLAIKHNAFIVLEDLNTGFKRGRQKIEKSIYQKFELALAKKLNFFVDKSVQNGEIGSVTKALQLTPPVLNYQDIENRKQVGIILYTRANYTSQTDPVTGWRKSVYLKPGSEENIKKQIVNIFSEIIFDGSDYYFEYQDENTKKHWKLYSGRNGNNLDRFRGARGKDKNEWIVEKKDVVQILNAVFSKFDKSKSLLSQIVDEDIQLTKYDEHTAWESLRYSIDIIQQIRNTGISAEDNDFLLSPIRDQFGNHFDTRSTSDSMPTSGDANGAFNIARKGIVMNEHIKRGLSLFIHDAEWDAWLSGREVWEKWVIENENILKVKIKK